MSYVALNTLLSLREANTLPALELASQAAAPSGRAPADQLTLETPPATAAADEQQQQQQSSTPIRRQVTDKRLSTTCGSLTIHPLSPGGVGETSMSASSGHLVNQSSPQRAANGGGQLVPMNGNDIHLRFGDLPSDPIERAYALTQRANKVVQGGLRSCEWTEVKDLYFRAAALFQEADMHEEAATAFNNSASIGRVMGDHLEVANAASHAIDSYKLVDPPEAVTRLQEVLEIHQNDGRRLLAAKAARDIAEIFEKQLGDDDGALHYYQIANSLFSGSENTRPQFMATLNKVATLQGKTKRYRDAVKTFEQIAESLTKGTRPTVNYMKALLCLLADAQGERQPNVLAKVKSEFDRYQDLDPHFQNGVEHTLIRELLFAWDKRSMALIDAAHKKYFEYREADVWVETLILTTRDNLFQYLLPFM